MCSYLKKHRCHNKLYARDLFRFSRGRLHIKTANEVLEINKQDTRSRTVLRFLNENNS